MQTHSTVSSSWLEKDLRSNWHPFTQMQHHEDRPPLLIESADGCYLVGADGTRYLDTIASWWCNIHGHNHPKIVQAVSNQAAQLSHIMYAGLTHKPVIELSERLVAITPTGLDRVFYTDNGSTAVEVALKCSVAYFKRIGLRKKTTFISLENGYHGDTIGCMAVSHVSLFNNEFSDLYTPAMKIPVPTVMDKPDNVNMNGFIMYCENVLTSYLKVHNDKVAALIVEPLLQAAGGFRIYPPEFLQRLHDICHDYNIHFIVDEVATGFGRTGHLFACDHGDIQPDFLCLSKGLTSGTLPFAATLMTEAIYREFYDRDRQKMFPHGHTYCANPLGCAAALATLAIFDSEETMVHARDITQCVEKEMQQFKSIKGIQHVRSIGTVGAMTIPAMPAIAHAIYEKGLAAGLLLRPLGTTLYFMPPLAITCDEYTSLMATVSRILTDSLSAC